MLYWFDQVFEVVFGGAWNGDRSGCKALCSVFKGVSGAVFLRLSFNYNIRGL